MIFPTEFKNILTLTFMYYFISSKYYLSMKILKNYYSIDINMEFLYFVHFYSIIIFILIVYFLIKVAIVCY